MLAAEPVRRPRGGAPVTRAVAFVAVAWACVGCASPRCAAFATGFGVGVGLEVADQLRAEAPEDTHFDLYWVARCAQLREDAVAGGAVEAEVSGAAWSRPGGACARERSARAVAEYGMMRREDPARDPSGAGAGKVGTLTALRGERRRD